MALAGATGRMGRLVAEAALQADDFELAAGIVRADGPAAGRPLSDFVPGARDLRLLALGDPQLDLGAADVLVDFSAADAAAGNARAAARHQCGLVVCTTGLGESHFGEIGECAKEVPVLIAPNTSVGVSLLHRLVRTACRGLPRGYDIEVVEAHHRNKADAPSGTALALGKTVCEEMDASLGEAAAYGRGPGSPKRRRDGEIGFSAVRGGDIAGEHTVLFIGDAERIELTHRAAKRSIFALGALEAARYVHRAAPGLYGMDDIFSEPPQRL